MSTLVNEAIINAAAKALYDACTRDARRAGARGNWESSSAAAKQEFQALARIALRAAVAESGLA